MQHYLTLEKQGLTFVCSIPDAPGEKLEFVVDVYRGSRVVRKFSVPLSRAPSNAVVDMADTIKLKWEIDSFAERGTSRRTKKRAR